MKPSSVHIAATIATVLVFHLSGALTAEQNAAIGAIEKFFAKSASPHEYCASRRLDASGWGQHAWLEVQTDFTVAAGMRYDVTAEGGSGYIRSHVLRPLLEEEQRVIALGRTAAVALTTDNYQFAAGGIDERGLAVIALKPLRKDRALIVGRMFLNAADGDLVRLEGLLARSPSFWVTRVNVVRRYRQIDGVIMPVSLDTTAQLRLFGASALRMTYHYSCIDGRPVADDSTDSEPAKAVPPSMLARIRRSR